MRKIWSHSDRVDRYEHAIRSLQRRGQTPETLLQIVQSKLSSNVNTYAQQTIRLRLLFDRFQTHNPGADNEKEDGLDGYMDERRFRECLELLTLQFDDVQALALFAYFDDECTGFIDWDHFSRHAKVSNPKAGSALLPKVITSRMYI